MKIYNKEQFFKHSDSPPLLKLTGIKLALIETHSIDQIGALSENKTLENFAADWFSCKDLYQPMNNLTHRVVPEFGVELDEY